MIFRILFAVLFALLLGHAAPAATPAEAVPPATAEAPSGGTMLMQKLREGGIVVLAQFLLSVIAGAFVVGCIVSIRKERIVPDGLAAKAADLWSNHKIDKLIVLEKEEPSTLVRAISFMLSHRACKPTRCKAACSRCGWLASRHGRPSDFDRPPHSPPGSITPGRMERGRVSGVHPKS